MSTKSRTRSAKQSSSKVSKTPPETPVTQDDSDSSSSDDLPLASKKYKKDIKHQQSSRFDFLLKQTEIFSHFMTADKAEGKHSPAKRGRKTKNEPAQQAEEESKTGKGGRRYKKTKRAADDELLKGDVAQRSKEIHFDTTPHYIKNGEMRDYQIRGLNWMISLMDNGINGILADEMGLGKTLQTVSLLGYLKHFRNNDGPHIVIVPKSTLQNWINEFKRWCPSLTVICLIGEKNARAQFITDVMAGTEWDVCVTSFDMCLREKACLKSYHWKYLVIDEAHRIKNENSLLAEIVRTFKSTNRLLLTGTPLQNNLHELWALLNFLLPDVFNSSEDFDTWFTTNSCLGDKAMVGRLHAILKPFLLRRLKAEVETSLLPKKEIKVYVGLSKMQREWYSKVLLKDIDIVSGCGKIEKMRLGMVLMHLRKVTNHPYLFDGAEAGPPYDQDLAHLVQNCGKMVILDRLLNRLKEEGSRVLIFSQMTRVLDILEDYCEWRGFKYHRLDGQTPHCDRAVMIDEYNAENSTSFIFMLSTRAGGLGINLATADSVIIYDSDWNPQVDLQAIDRAHRIGQKKQVRVFRLITENTIDEKIIERAEIKLRLDRMVIQKGLVTENTNKIDKMEMLNMIRFGATHILKSKESDISEEDIDTILKKCEARTQAELDKLEKLEAEGEGSLRKFTLDIANAEPSSVYQFEGENWLEKQKLHKAEMFIELPKRSRKLVNYSGMNEGSPSSTQQGPQQKLQNIMPKGTTSTTATNSPMAPIDVYPKPQPFYDFQFLPPRVYELAEKEKFYYYKLIDYKIPITCYNNTNSNIARYNQRIEMAQPLTNAERAEKQKLMREGFPHWSKRTYDQYINAVIDYGFDDVASIFACVEGKFLREIEIYNKAFQEKFTELKDSQFIIDRMKEGAAKREKKAAIKRAVDAKVNAYRQPFLELKFNYPPHLKWKYTEEADRFLICTLQKLGVNEKNVYASLRSAVRTMYQPKLGNDTFLKSKSAMNLHERCDYLISLILAEMTENGGVFEGTKNKPAVISGPVVDLDSSDEEESKSSSDVVLVEDDDSSMEAQPRVEELIRKMQTTKKSAVSAPEYVIYDSDSSSGSSSSNRTEVEEVVPLSSSSDSEEFDLTEFLAKNGYQSHGQHLKRAAVKANTSAPKRQKLALSATSTKSSFVKNPAALSKKIAETSNETIVKEPVSSDTIAKNCTIETSTSSKSNAETVVEDPETIATVSIVKEPPSSDTVASNCAIEKSRLSETIAETGNEKSKTIADNSVVKEPALLETIAATVDEDPKTIATNSIVEEPTDQLTKTIVNDSIVEKPTTEKIIVSNPVVKEPEESLEPIVSSSVTEKPETVIENSETTASNSVVEEPTEPLTETKSVTETQEMASETVEESDIPLP